MRKQLFFIFVFVAVLLTYTQFAAADFILTNNSTTAPVWVTYSVWKPASGIWPAGWRTQGWYKIESNANRTFQVPQNNPWAYIRVVGRSGEIKPPDHATRDSSPFWIHPSKPFTVVEANEGEFLKGNHNRGSLKQQILYKYLNGGCYTIVSGTDQNLPNPSVERIYDQAMRSVVWIINFHSNSQGKSDSQGSGVLIDEERKFVVTNAHVTEQAKQVVVCFPVPDSKGNLISNRGYYIENYESLLKINYAHWGRVIAEDSKRDLAIVQLDSLPGTTRAIDHNLGADLSRNISKGAPVHILGNPGKLDLWRWTVGLFQSDIENWLYINADIFGGNSGGPVLNEQGKLIGIVALSNRRTKAWAVPARYVKALLDTIGPKHTFSIRNPAPFTVHYQIKWSNNHDWETQSIDSDSDPYYHWWTREEVPVGYPLIRFDSVVDDNRFTERVIKLDTYLRYFGLNYRNNLIAADAFRYRFNYNRQERSLNLLEDLGWAGAWPAPTLNLQQGNFDGLTASEIQLLLLQAKQLDVGDPTIQKSIQDLEQLLATVTEAETMPEETVLLPNYPNPFNPETWMPYQLSKPAHVTMTLYSADGRLIRTLRLGHQPAGVYQSKSRAAYWDGKNELGEKVASGLYFYTFTAGDFNATRKMLIRK